MNSTISKSWRELLLVTLLALLGAFVIVRQVVRPTYTDSFYHFNAAVRLVDGQGLTDEVIWTYIGQPETPPTLDTPSHLYWMPFASMLSGISMAIFNTPGNYDVSQFPAIALFAGTILIGYALGYQFGGTRRHAITAALLTLSNGFFAKFWGETDTFAPYAFTGALCLFALSRGLTGEHPVRRLTWFALAGLMAGFGHLTRSDGLLLPIVGVLTIVSSTRIFNVEAQYIAPLQSTIDLYSPDKRKISLRLWVGIGLIAFLLAYLLVMTPYFLRMIAVTGSPLPVGGLQAVWFTEYNDLFRYPPDASAGEFFANGLGLLISTRWTALIQNLQTFLFVEGYIVLMPLMLLGCVRVWRKDSRGLLPMGLFALGLHAAMTLVFPFPGWRGGLLHGAAALIPYWAALAVVGLDSVVDWIAQRREHWQPTTAKRIFSACMVLLALVLTFTIIRTVRQGTTTPTVYAYLQTILPADARVLMNDPSQFYYFTGLGGAVLPDESAEVIPVIARRYGITHVLIEDVQRDANGRLFSTSTPASLQDIFTAPFLREIDTDFENVRLYAINPQ